jgi:hypothetical protein
MVQGVEKAEGNRPTKVFILQTGAGRPYIGEITFWPKTEEKEGSIQKVPEVGKMCSLKCIVRGDKFGLKCQAE